MTNTWITDSTTTGWDLYTLTDELGNWLGEVRGWYQGDFIVQATVNGKREFLGCHFAAAGRELVEAAANGEPVPVYYPKEEVY